MATIDPILIQIKADVSQLKTGLAQAEGALKGLDGSVKTASTGMTNFASKLKSVGATIGLAFAGTQIASFAKSSVMAASDMAESLSKVQVVFGQGSDAVIKFGKDAASNMGISNQAALEAAGTYGNLFQAFGLGQGEAQKMSTSLVQLASDMASFNNTSVDDAILALRSGLSGETEPLKKFGVALSDVRLKTEAMSMGLIKNTSDALTPAAKAQASYALIMKDTILAQGDYARTADGTANTMKTLAAQLQDAKVALGDALMPAFRALLSILKVLIPILRSIGSYFKENYDAIKMYAIIVGTLVAALYTYRAALVTVKVTQQAFVVMQTLMKGATLASIASTNGLAASMLVLNAAIRANPIGLIVTAVIALGAAFVYAWKHSETFRSIVIAVAQAVANAFAKVIEILGKFFGLLGKAPGMGWAKSISSGLDSISTKIKTTSNNLSDLKSNFKGMGNISMTAGSAGVTGGSTGGGTTGGGIDPNAAKEMASKEKKRLADIKANQKKLDTEYKDLAKLEEKKAKLIDDYARDVAKRNLKYDEDVAKAKENHAKRVLDMEKDYNKQILEANRDAANKRREIVQQSIDRLRDVFRSASALDVGKMFSDLLKGEDPTQATAGTLVDKFKKQLEDVRALSANATALANKGFSQVFIEQVVSQGTDVGNQLATELLNATPETVAQMQDLFTQVQETSNHGLDALATSMNAGLNLATEELKLAYAQVGVDLNEALAQYALDFAEAMTEAKQDLTDTLAELQKELNKDLAEMQDAFNIALAEINKDIQATINQIFALIAAISALGGVAKGSLTGSKTDSGASSQMLKNQKNWKPFATGGIVTGPTRALIGEAGPEAVIPLDKMNKLGGTVNISIQNTNTQSDQDTANAILRAMRFGQVVQVSGGVLNI
jgi:hypothetical protein